jgi:hypothetical protein
VIAQTAEPHKAYQARVHQAGSIRVSDSRGGCRLLNAGLAR